MFAWHCVLLASSRLVSLLDWKVPDQLPGEAVSPGRPAGPVVKVSVWSRGKVGRTVRVLGGRREGSRGPVDPGRGGCLAGTVGDISESLPDSSDTPEAPGPHDAMPGRGAERLPGKSVHVKPID